MGTYVLHLWSIDYDEEKKIKNLKSLVYFAYMKMAISPSLTVYSFNISLKDSQGNSAPEEEGRQLCQNKLLSICLSALKYIAFSNDKWII